MRNGSRNSRISIEMGDLFVRTDAPHIVWRVVRLVPTQDGIGHVLLELRSQPTTTKLLAQSALSNRREFKRIGYEPIEALTPVTLFDVGPSITAESRS